MLAQTHSEVQWALTQGANPNEDDALAVRLILERRTPFWGEAQQVVRQSLEHGLDAMGRNDNNQTLLHYCTDIPSIDVLIEAGSPVNAMDCSSKTPFQYMCAQRQWNAASALLQRGGIAGQRHISPSDMGNIFISAISQWRATSNASLLDLLERIWPYVDVAQMTSSSLKSLLHMQARMIVERGNAPHWAQSLLQQLTAQHVTSCLTAHPLSFPLWDAARKGDVCLLDYMLEQGQSVEQTDGHGNTALHAAVAAGQFDAAQRLLRAGADSNALNKYKQSPMFFLHYPYLAQEDARALLGCKGIDLFTALLMDHGAILNLLDGFGQRIPTVLPLPPQPWRGHFLPKALEHLSYNMLMSHHQNQELSAEVEAHGQRSGKRRI